MSSIKTDLRKLVARDFVLEELFSRVPGTEFNFESIQERYARCARETTEPDTEDRLLQPVIKFRSIFVSDLHLGTPAAQARQFVQMLAHVDSEYIYLNGDIIDLWGMKRNEVWKLLQQESAQQTVFQKLLRELRKGKKLIVIPGNHDEAYRQIIKPYNAQPTVHNLDILLYAIHDTADGKRVLVMHGDSFDELVRNHRLLSILVTQGNEKLAKLSIMIDQMRANYPLANAFLDYFNFDKSYSIAYELRNASDRSTLNKAHNDIVFDFVAALNADIRAYNAKHPGQERKTIDKVICGHTHFAAAIERDGITYLNDGHWTGPPRSEDYAGDDAWRDRRTHPTCTFVAETLDGQLNH